MQVSYLADVPHMAAALIPGLLDHWRFALPDDTAAARAGRLRKQENRHEMPIAWVAHTGDVAHGTAALRTTDLAGHDDVGPWLGGVYVLPQFRGQGVAAALCRTVEQKAREMGHSRLYLFTLDQESLYAHLGWVTLQAADWQGHPCKIMVKDLAWHPPIPA